MISLEVLWENRLACCQEFVIFFIETVNKNFTEFFNVRKFLEILHYSLLVRILESSNFTYGPLPLVDQLKYTLVKNDRKSAMPKSTHF